MKTTGKSQRTYRLNVVQIYVTKQYAVIVFVNRIISITCTLNDRKVIA